MAATTRPKAGTGASRRPRPASRPAVRLAARAFVALVSGGIALLAGGYLAGPEHFWPVAQAQYVPYPAYLLPALTAAALSVLLGWRWRVLAALGLLLAVTVLMGFEANLGGAKGEGFRVMTYNVKGYLARRSGEGFGAIAREIALHDPDLLVLQDARELQEASTTGEASASAVLGRRHVYALGQYVVASRYPLRECRPRRIPIRGQPHSYVSCVVVAKGVEFEIVTAHFLTPRHGLNATREDPLGGIDDWKQNMEDRLSQAQTLAGDLRKLWRPLVVAGDLNAPTGSLVVRSLLETGLRDAFSEAGAGFGYTWGHSLGPGLSFLRIDHILASPEFGVIRCFTGGDEGSAHRPVIADLLLPGAGA